MNDFKVTLCDYKNLSIELDTPAPSVTIDELEAQKKLIADSFSELVEVEGALKNGQTSIIDFVGSVDGVEFEGGKAENYELVIGSGMFIPGFEAQMVGMVKGETRIVKVRFPDEYTPELAGKDAEFKVTVNAIKEKTAVAFDEGVLKKFTEAQGLNDIDTMEKFDKFLLDAIYSKKAEAVDKEISAKIEALLLEGCVVDIPSEVFEAQAQKQIAEIEAYAKSNGMELDTMLAMMGQNLESFKASVIQMAKNDLCINAIFDEIARVEGITASDTELNDFYQRASSAKGITLDEAKKEYPEAETKRYISIIKASSFIRGNAKISHK